MFAQLSVLNKENFCFPTVLTKLTQLFARFILYAVPKPNQIPLSLYLKGDRKFLLMHDFEVMLTHVLTLKVFSRI